MWFAIPFQNGLFPCLDIGLMSQAFSSSIRNFTSLNSYYFLLNDNFLIVLGKKLVFVCV